MARNERTGKRVGKIAAKGLKDPKSLSPRQIKSLSASALTQRPNKPKGRRGR